MAFGLLWSAFRVLSCADQGNERLQPTLADAFDQIGPAFRLWQMEEIVLDPRFPRSGRFWVRLRTLAEMGRIAADQDCLTLLDLPVVPPDFAGGLSVAQGEGLTDDQKSRLRDRLDPVCQDLSRRFCADRSKASQW